jgi:serine/threonine protein kinase
VKELGNGGKGMVFLVEDCEHNKFAMKRIPLNPSKKLELKEINVFFNPKLHSEHLVRYYEQFSDDLYLNIRMEYCENGNLEDYINNHGNFCEHVLFFSNIFAYFFSSGYLLYFKTDSPWSEYFAQ